MYSATVNNETFFRTDLDSDLYLATEFEVNLVAGQAGEANFSLPPCNMKQNLQWNKYTTFIRLFRDGKKIFTGRVYKDPEIDFDGIKNISCEGIKGILNDAVIVPFTGTFTTEELFYKFIDEFNEQTGFSLTVRNITVEDIDSSSEVEETGWSTALEHLDSLVNEYGGYMDVIEADDGTLYIDWLKEYTEVNAQKIQLGENLMDLIGSDATDVIYTHLIPLGSSQTDDDGLSTGSRLTIESVNNGSYYISADAEYITKYGNVYGTKVYDDIDDASELMSKGQEDLADMLNPKSSYEVTSVDLADFGLSVDSFEIRKLAVVDSPANGIEDMQVPVLQLSLNILDPSRNKMVLSNGIKAYSAGENGRISSAAKDIYLQNEAGLSDRIRNKLANMISVSGTTLVIETRNANGGTE